MKHLRAVAGLVLVLTCVTACGNDNAGGDDTTTLTVYAASSLKTSFESIGAEFEAAHAGVHVRFNFAGSSDLVAQVQGGAPADVIATADTANMDKLVADQLASAPRAFASNTLEIAVPPGNPADIHGLQDLAGKGIYLVTCAPEVPCGAAAQKAELAAGVILHPVSEEQSVADVLGKVTSGEADAGLVYVTDVLAAGDAVEGVPFAESASAVNVYPIATLPDSRNADLAQQFADLVLGASGQAILQQAGFAKP